MATQLVCDGCRTPLYQVGKTREQNGGVGPDSGRELIVKGDRANGMSGFSPVPSGEFTWCGDCSRIAFKAVQDAQLRKAGWTQ